MLLKYSSLLLRNQPLWEQTCRHFFKFGRKTPKPIPIKISEERKKGDILETETTVSDKIHELNKEKKEVNELPIKQSPADPEKRAQWLTKQAPIFYVPRERSGYAPEYEPEYSLRSLKQGFKYLCEELKLWWKETATMQVITEYPPSKGCVEKEFVFRGPETIHKWITTCDSDHNEGFSTVDFSCTKDGRALFSGVLSTRLPKDGKMKFAGYCNVRSPVKYKSFKTIQHLRWMAYNTLELRIRGDGRTYLMNLHSPGPWDVTWDDVFNYPLYTRGGPYWQTVRIPFSKFIFSNKGRIQDVQYPLPHDMLHFISITLMDNTDGPFSLEIDYIGALFDPSHDEKSAYEEYRVKNFIIQN